MGIPYRFDPMGTLGGELPYLPADFPFRADVIDGVWFGRLVSTGSTGDPEIPALNPPRFFFDSPFKTEAFASPCCMVVKNGYVDAVLVQYDDVGDPHGLYFNVGVLGAFYNSIQYVTSVSYTCCAILFDDVRPEFCVPDNFERRAFGISAHQEKAPERANKMLVTSSVDCGLFFRRTLSAQEMKTVYEYVKRKQS